MSNQDQHSSVLEAEQTRVKPPPLYKVVTYDFARLMPGATQVSCSAFGAAMIERM